MQPCDDMLDCTVALRHLLLMIRDVILSKQPVCQVQSGCDILTIGFSYRRQANMFKSNSFCCFLDRVLCQARAGQKLD